MKKSLIILIIIFALALFGLAFVRDTFNSKVDNGELVAIDKPDLPSEEPNIIKPEDIPEAHYPGKFSIPKLEVEASVQRVGIKDNGDMANPTNFTDVGWFRLGVAPGYVGSSVIAGHVDNGLGKAGVFYDLHKLRIGDSVNVLREDGITLHFKVTDIKSYPYNDAPLTDIFARSDKARLNLITCIGDWLKDEKTYTDRLVVYTELVE